jgi:hypothetical protein
MAAQRSGSRISLRILNRQRNKQIATRAVMTNRCRVGDLDILARLNVWPVIAIADFDLEVLEVFD